ncbi:MAG TPA: hypothetical protein EYP98_16155 [Planctomycetes bacterium]|nr:hypothetical protein [Planctomycetota bacterium]
MPSNSPSGFEFGADGAIFWLSFTTKRVQGGDDTWGGFSLFAHFGSNGGEKLFIGAPFQFNEIGIDDQAGAWLADRGYEPVYGARPLKRGIEKLIEDPLSEQILKGKLGEPYEVTAQLDGDDVSFKMVKRPPKPKEEAETEKAAATTEPSAESTPDSDKDEGTE